MSATTPTILEKPRTRLRSGGGAGGGGKGGGGGGSQATVRLRVVVRHLPSLLKEDEFREGMAEYVNEETTEWLSWTQGKIPAEFSFPIFVHGRNKLPIYSRCYIKFKTPIQITALNDALRSHGPFVDSKGNATNPQMEYSPFQKFPKKGGRVDVRAGTIESDPDFVAFLASINGVGTVPTSNGAASADGTAPSAEGTAGTMTASPSGSALPNDPLSVPLPSGEKPEKPKSTPLIDFLRQQKAAAAAEKAAPGSSKAKSPKDGKDGKEVASSSSRRSDKRRMEKIRAKGKERDDTGKGERAIKQAIRAVDMETATILSREWSGSRREGSISTSGRDRESKVDKATAGETEKPKRERRRGGNAAGVAAILQRDLGLAGPRRSRGNKPALEPTTPIVEEGTAPSRPTPAAVMSNSPPAINAQLSHIGPQSSTQEVTPKTPRSRGGSRRDRRNRLDREDSTASVASASSPPPIAILKKQPSSGPSPISPEVPTLLKRQSSASGPPPTAPSGPASSAPASHTTPTAPKGDSGRRRHGRGEGRGGANGGGSGSGGGGRNPRPPVDTQPTQQQGQPAIPGVPTAPAGDINQPGGREGRGRRGSTSGGGGGGGGGSGGGGGRSGFRGGRGRGGGQGRGRGGPIGVNVTVAGGGGEGTS
ncbi:hypothetical protein Q9L58_010533 [Maublancomyces gigas]|uniref:UPF3 domain-containing protein n=1 Tax=Discina gigas TaxID=1032678 RepID=A0ABR3G3V5_9PEZI